MKILRFLAFLLISLFLAWLVHYVLFIRRYGVGYDYDTMSDALFIVGVIGFLPAFMMHIGTYRFFFGMQYALKSLFRPEFKKKYKVFSDYLIDKNQDANTTIYLELMFAALTLIVLSLIFALSWSRTI